MNVKCPECRSAIPLDDVNVATDLALCRRCGKTHSYSDLVKDEETGPVDLMRPPKGAWFRQDMSGFEVGATTRSAAAFFLVPFMTLWSGFSLGGIYGSQIVNGKFNAGMSLFGLPFVLGTIIFGSITLMAVCGKVVVRVQGDRGEAFTGVWRFGWRRRFDWDKVTAVRLTERVKRRDTNMEQLLLDGPKPVTIAAGLARERLRFMAAALRRVHSQR